MCIFVVVGDKKIIPYLGQGPITVPTPVSEEVHRKLVIGGFAVTKVKDPDLFFSEASAQNGEQQVIKEEPVSPEPVPEVTVSPVEETPKEEPVVEEPTPEVPSVDEYVMTKKELIALLKKKNIPTKYHDTVKDLHEKARDAGLI